MRAARGVCQTADMRMAKAVTASGHHQYVNYPTGSSVLFYCSSARITARGSGTGSYPDMSNRPCFVALVKLCGPLRWQRVLPEHVVNQPGHAGITLREGGAVAGLGSQKVRPVTLPEAVTSSPRSLTMSTPNILAAAALAASLCSGTEMAVGAATSAADSAGSPDSDTCIS